MNIKDTAQEFALTQWLEYWPSDWTYEDIIDKLKFDDYEDDIVVRDFFNEYDGNSIAIELEYTRILFTRYVVELLEMHHRAMLQG